MQGIKSATLEIGNVSSKSRICVNFGQKVNFLKRTPIQHFHSCFLVFSYHFTIISEQNLECILPTHLLMFSNGVKGKKLRFIFFGINITCNITFLWIKARIFFNFVDLISSHKSYIPILMQPRFNTGSYVLI